MNTPDDFPPRGPDADDEAWLALLAGRPAPQADPNTRQEATLLRLAVLRQSTQSDAEWSDADYARSAQRLQFALHRAGLGSASARPWWQHPSLALGLAAGLAGLILLPSLRWESPLTPGGEAASSEPPRIKQLRLPNIVRVDRPAATAQALAEALNRLGLAAQPVQHEQRWRLEVVVPDPPPPTLAGVLGDYRLRLPRDRHLLVEFVPIAP